MKHVFLAEENGRHLCRRDNVCWSGRLLRKIHLRHLDRRQQRWLVVMPCEIVASHKVCHTFLPFPQI